jgi:hypothetical protein
MKPDRAEFTAPTSVLTSLLCNYLASVSEGDVFSGRDSLQNLNKSFQSLINWIDACDVQQSRTSKQMLVLIATVVISEEYTKQSLAMNASKSSQLCGSDYTALICKVIGYNDCKLEFIYVSNRRCKQTPAANNQSALGFRGRYAATKQSIGAA